MAAGVPRIADDLTDPRTAVIRIDDKTAVLDAIEQLTDAFAELADGWHTKDVEDFESGLRQLRCIVLARRVDGQQQM